MTDETNKSAPAPEGISLLPDVLSLAQTLAQPTDVTNEAMATLTANQSKPKKAKKAKAAPAPAATVDLGINLPDPAGVAVSVSGPHTVAITGVGDKPVGEWVAQGIYPISLPGPLHVRLRKEVTGVGGWQTLMNELRACTLPDVPVIMLPRTLMLTMIPKAVVHGSGGYQGVIRWILCLLLEQHTGAVLAPATK